MESPVGHRLGRFRGILFVVAFSGGAFLVARVPALLGLPDPGEWVFRNLEGTGLLFAGVALIVGFLVLTIRRGTRLRRGFDVRVKAEAVAVERRAAEAERTRIFNAIAHELGNLITPMRLQVDILQSAPDLAPQATPSVAILERSVGRLAGFLQDLLDLARLQSHQLRLDIHRVDLAKVAQAAVATYQPTSASRGVQVMFAGNASDAVVSADARRIDQVLSNLLGNAIKFTPSGGQVDVTIEPLADDVVVRVRDTGPGISSEDMARLFQAFATLGSNGQGALTGTGLGLFISKSLVEAHGGRIGVESPGPGMGSTFHVSLPRLGAKPAGAVAGVQPDRPRVTVSASMSPRG